MNKGCCIDYGSCKEGELQLVATGHEGGFICLIDYVTGEQLKCFQQNRLMPSDVLKLSVCGHLGTAPLIVVGSKLKPVEVIDYHTATVIQTIGTECISYSLLKQPSYLVAVSMETNSSLTLFDYSNGKRLYTLRGHSSPVLSVELMSMKHMSSKTVRGRFKAASCIAVSGSSSDVKLWNLDDGTCIRTVLSQKKPIPQLKLYPQSTTRLYVLVINRNGKMVS